MIDKDLAEQWATLNVTVEADDEEEAIDVWRINLQSVMAFFRCETQWRSLAAPAGDGHRLVWLGIDYASAHPVFARRDRVRERQLLGDIQVMELAALEAWREVG
ncbi:MULTISPECIES: DUF1799 domain-containing protein [unclassified Mesorhizobium]|uniref:DUF1799 domain-containing protein n=1 Tax=unclassified Mesorhizobium TaxID=325217 RepID=UPI0003CEE167|nr:MULTISPECIES: DUF1799 domain-containing protein [unclassified Mesorhizobium]ESY49020.1 hypothetical protein X745_27985 [Mesorhizobium sp. LNJC374B00]ESY52742.1 hypothetical protein X744_28615 [Mesorhizobium sp. LNJC372A00]WJI81464.1 DUF1799 domain-containing protein [Mesorhizobium sp. C374B]WJI87983.1 DUF1799 domain-containing protein [Mesorhizobium sp. C372A]